MKVTTFVGQAARDKVQYIGRRTARERETERGIERGRQVVGLERATADTRTVN